MEQLNPEWTRTDERGMLTQLFTGQFEQVNLLHIKEGKILGGHYHKKNMEVFYIWNGAVQVIINKKEFYTFMTGQLFKVLPEEEHSIEALVDTKLIVLLTYKYNEKEPDIHDNSIKKETK